MKQSAGILLYKKVEGKLLFFLVHPGGPFFAKKNEGWWTVPKGELLPDELPLDAAVREFKEETGYKPLPPFLELQPITQKAGKQVLCWAAVGNLDAATITCNTFEIEWPPKSGKIKAFAEVDKAGWFMYDEAKLLINERQVAFLDEFILKLS
ncbi:NUDIX domain-containing protein [Flavobacterium subsaxonicum]|uniref:NUDIX hydrolase n=1 Tax=Flavobacterium subsaxonicum WB 4.1-42 = DSM 21790 TaxID=1121898 RepID=A0A0A2MLN5_9FLAO|nr:NUDIX domain-containing protein [Flavobacterium subsaxonicum]KGO92403.1 NUDIX hydrolase [Flavobacterium subsaxonicum WB 4.1-42 = DSM 21790]